MTQICTEERPCLPCYLDNGDCDSPRVAHLEWQRMETPAKKLACKEQDMKRVFLCSPTNSTMFTSCCRTAINSDQALCPVCKEEVYPGLDATTHQRSTSRWQMAYSPTRGALKATTGSKT